MLLFYALLIQSFRKHDKPFAEWQNVNWRLAIPTFALRSLKTLVVFIENCSKSRPVILAFSSQVMTGSRAWHEAWVLQPESWWSVLIWCLAKVIDAGPALTQGWASTLFDLIHCSMRYGFPGVLTFILSNWRSEFWQVTNKPLKMSHLATLRLTLQLMHFKLWHVCLMSQPGFLSCTLYKSVNIWYIITCITYTWPSNHSWCLEVTHTSWIAMLLHNTEALSAVFFIRDVISYIKPWDLFIVCHVNSPWSNQLYNHFDDRNLSYALSSLSNHVLIDTSFKWTQWGWLNEGALLKAQQRNDDAATLTLEKHDITLKTYLLQFATTLPKQLDTNNLRYHIFLRVAF